MRRSRKKTLTDFHMILMLTISVSTKKVVVRIISRRILNGLLETLKHGELLETINILKNSAVLTTANKTELCEWLCKFVSNTRKGDGKEYTPRSIYLLLAGLQRHIRKLNPTTDINSYFSRYCIKAFKMFAMLCLNN